MINPGNLKPKLCFGTILSADPVKRTYTVEYTTPEGAMSTRGNVQALSAVASMEGDECSAMSETGSSCITLVLSNSVFILGFHIPPLINTPSVAKNIETGAGNEGSIPGSSVGNRASVDVGDQIFGTRGKNRLILRRSGVIEIEASKTCRRTMTPDDSAYIDICKNYQFGSDGMTVVSKNIPKGIVPDQTYYGTTYKDNLAPKNIITIERGTVSPSDSELIEKYAIGSSKTKSVAIDETVYVRFMKNTGEVQEAINPGGGDPKPDSAAWYRGIDAEGNYEETINAKTYALTITSDGNITRETAGDYTDTIKGLVTVTYEKDYTSEIKGKLSQKITDAVSIEYGGDLEQKIKGDVKESHGSSRKMEGKQKEYIELAGGKVAIGNAGVELVDIVHQICQNLSQTLTPGYNGPISTAAQFATLMGKLAALKK